jgi:hypothetical protein
MQAHLMRRTPAVYLAFVPKPSPPGDEGPAAAPGKRAEWLVPDLLGFVASTKKIPEYAGGTASVRYVAWIPQT